METIVRDLRHAVRLLTRNPGFTITAVISLALGIGANSALFGMFNSLLWRPLPVEDPERIVVIYSNRKGQAFSQGFSAPEVRELREQQEVFTGLAGHSPYVFGLRGDGREDTRAFGELVSDEYFQVLGVQMALGRGFRPDEARAPVAVLNHRFWSRHFDADPAVIGRTLTLNGQAFSVVGVTPPGFNGTYAIYFSPDLWVPLLTLPQLAPETGSARLEDRSTRFIRINGRLRPGVSVDRASAAVDTIMRRLEQSYPATNTGVGALVVPELETRPEVEISAATNAIAMVFLALTALVLLVACANVANLLLARATARRREMALRVALGATGRHLVRQLMIESMLLALIAGGVGLALGAVASRLLASVRVPTDIPLVLEFHTDLRVTFYTLGTAVLAAVAFGLVPAWRASRPDLVPALKGEEVRVRTRRLTLSGLLVVLQVATSMVLLVASGLFVRSVAGARTIDPGFATANRVVLSLDPSLQQYDRDRTTRFYRRLLERLRMSAAIKSAALARDVPLDFSIEADQVLVEGRATDPDEDTPQIMYSIVDDHYFATLGTPLRAGRPFSPLDTAGAPRVAIVNETMAARFWPGQDPLGRRFRFEGAEEPWMTVVGVAATGKYRQLTESPRPFFFVPDAQVFRSRRTLVLELHRADALAEAVSTVRREVQAIDPGMPVFDVKTMDQFMERAYLGPRLAALLVGPAGLLALVIAAVGLYGVMAFWVSRRMREMGIRLAIGATSRDLLQLVMGQGLALAGIGVVVGLAAAAAGSRLVANLLFGVSATDPVVFVMVPVILLITAALASYGPARRALRADPLASLRSE